MTTLTKEQTTAEKRAMRAEALRQLRLALKDKHTTKRAG